MLHDQLSATAFQNATAACAASVGKCTDYYAH